MRTINIQAASATKQLRAVTIRSGIITAGGLILYFIAMRIFNLHFNLKLHYFNILILFFGLRYAIKHIRSVTGEIRYFEGLKSGLIVTLIAMVIFNLFMVIYETLIDPSFLEYLQQKISLGSELSLQGTVFNVVGLIFIEGLSSGFILTFALMQYYKAESSETK